jgi:hypothetical protein
MNIAPHLRHINSMTKYPQIETYHKLDTKSGVLLEEPVSFGGDNDLVFCTEKVNGTNGRIILFPDGDWIIGSREELLYARGDRIPNPALGIVEALMETATRLGEANKHPITVVFYGEAYGHGIEGGKAYTRTKEQTGFRLFDVVLLETFDEMLTWPIEKVASWRQHGGQLFFAESELAEIAKLAELPLCPRIVTCGASELPTSVEQMHAMLTAMIPFTTVALDENVGRAEGFVVRSFDRTVIAKARFEDYERTARKRART